MTDKKLESLKKILEIKKRKKADIKDHFNYSSKSNVRIRYDPEYYKGEKILRKKIFNKI